MRFQALLILAVRSPDLLCVALPVQGSYNIWPCVLRKGAHDGHDLMQLVMLKSIQWLSYFLYAGRCEECADDSASHALVTTQLLLSSTT